MSDKEQTVEEKIRSKVDRYTEESVSNVMYLKSGVFHKEWFVSHMTKEIQSLIEQKNTSGMNDEQSKEA